LDARNVHSLDRDVERAHLVDEVHWRYQVSVTQPPDRFK
jgi:hypothetical protein